MKFRILKKLSIHIDECAILDANSLLVTKDCNILGKQVLSIRPLDYTAAKVWTRDIDGVINGGCHLQLAVFY